jgi:hypothetical protein
VRERKRERKKTRVCERHLITKRKIERERERQGGRERESE